MSDDLKSQRDRYIAFSLAAADLLIEVDAAFCIVSVVGAAKALLGEPAASLVGRKVSTLFADFDQGVVGRLLTKSKTVGRIEPCSLYLLAAGGRNLRVNMGACFLHGASTQTYITITVLSDTLGLSAEPRDDDTGLLNQAAYEELTNRLLNEGGSKAPSALKMIRLKGLPDAVRDLSPDQAGALLYEIGAVMRGQALGGTMAGRLSDDAFSYLPVASDPAADKTLVTEMQAVAQAAGLKAGSLNPSIISLELSTAGLDKDSIAKALAYALNDVCKEGAPAPKSLAQSLNAAMAETVKQFGNIRQLIETRNFTLNYQPVVQLDTRELHHYEALARFSNNRSPYETIRLSEQLGLVPAFDLAVCQKACEMLIEHPEAHIAVNISGVSLENASFREDLRKLLMALSGIDGRLMFELTESSEIKDLPTASSYLRWLRRSGYRVCLDDFGAGAAAYAYLRYLEVDYVKIDGNFVKEAKSDVRQRALLRSIASLCDELDTEVIAEMIEDEAAAKMCSELGIGLGQGFLYGKPKPEIDAPKESARRKGFSESWA